MFLTPTLVVLPLVCCLLPCCCPQVKSEWDNYENSYGKDAGEGIKDRSKTTQLVDVFYSLVGGVGWWVGGCWETGLHCSCTVLPKPLLYAGPNGYMSVIAGASWTA